MALMNRAAVLLLFIVRCISALSERPGEFSDLARFSLISNRVISRRICSQDCGFSVCPISRGPSNNGPQEVHVLRRHRTTIARRPARASRSAATFTPFEPGIPNH